MKKSSLRSSRTSYALTRSLLCGSTLAFLATAGVGLAADSAASNPIADTLQGDWGQIKLDLRYRFEHVEQDGLKTTNGDPIRLRLGYLTPKLAGFQAFAELEGDTPVFEDDYNDTTNGKNRICGYCRPIRRRTEPGMAFL